LRSFRRGVRGVSPILGSVIMILIVVIAMGAVFAFFVDYVGDYQQGQGSAVMELVEIEDVFFNSTSGSADVWLYNYGEIEFRLDSVYVNGLNATLSESVAVLPLEHAKFSVDVSGGWLPGASYVFRFVTERGSAVERAYVSP
jgi:flagellin-like protein